MRLSRSISVLCLLLSGAALPALAFSNSADAPHVHVELLVLPQALNRGEAAEAGLYFKIDHGWHVYWQNAGDAGEPPHLRWTLPAGWNAGPLQFPAPKRLPLGPLMDFGYEVEVLFPLAMQVPSTASAGSAVLHAKADWLVCQSSCIPGKAELEVTRNVLDHPAKPVSLASDSALFKRFAALLPTPLPASARLGFAATAEGFRLTVETGKRENHAVFFPEDQDTLDNPAPQKLTPTARGFTLDLKKDAQLKETPKQLRGVLELSGGRAYEIVALQGPAVAPRVAANEPRTASQAAAQAGDSKSPVQPASPVAGESTPVSLPQRAAQAGTSPAPQGPTTTGAELLRAVGLAFLGGLLLNLMPCVFPVLFLKGLALVRSGNKERRTLRSHGLVYAAGILVSFWVLVGALLGLRAAGAVLGWGFQFQSPVFLALMAGLLFLLGLSLAGQFEIGLTLTSAGSSLAAKEGYTGSFFTGVLAVVVATPCTAPLMGPAIGYALAQSAVVSLAVFTALALGLAVPYVALTLQPAWTRWLPKPGVWMEILRQATAVPIFATVIWLAWVLAAAYGAGLLAALLAGFLLLAIAGWFLGRWPARRWATIVASLFLVAVIALDTLAPRQVAVQTREVTASESGGWQPWSAEAVSRAQAAGQPVFVDFTASWCLSCQVNERVALNRPEVRQAFAERRVVLLKADWTRHDEAITQALTELGRSGVPTYALYRTGRPVPELLPEVLTPGVVMEALNGLRRP